MKSQKYSRLTYAQRQTIKQMKDDGKKNAVIAQTVGIHISTLYRELRRGDVNGIYAPEQSEQIVRSHFPHKGPKPIFKSKPELARYIARLILEEHLSPERIVEKLEQEESAFKGAISSPKTIYNAIDRNIIPGVTRESLHTNTVTLCNDLIWIPRWFQKEMGFKDGDQFLIEKTEQGQIVMTKIEKEN